MTDTRNVFVLILSVMIVQIAGGLLSMLTPLGLEAMGTGPQTIGVIAGFNAAGYMIGAWSAPRMLGMFGNIRLFAAASAINAVAVLSLSLWHDAAFWALLRIVQGISFAYMFTSIESWMGEAVPDKSRGNVMGIYHTGAKLSLMIGPFFVAGMSPLDSRAYSWAALFLALALVPVCLTRQKEPPPPDRKSMPVTELFTIAPAAVIGVFLAGVINTGTLALLPIYFEGFDLAGGGTAAAAIAGAAAWLGGLVLQWPAGVLSDRVERRLVIAGMCTMSGIAALLIAIFGRALGEIGVIAVLTIWGAGALSFYGLCVAHAIDRAPRGRVPQVMSGLLFIWAAGSIIGPLMSGFAMRMADRVGLFGLAGVLLLVLAALMVIRVRQRAAPTEAQQEEWKPITPTSLAGVELDPRNPELEA
jgi:MFS family permease